MASSRKWKFLLAQSISEIFFCSVLSEQGKGSNGFLQRGAGDVHGQPGRWSGPFLLSSTRDCPVPLRLMLVNGPCPSQIVSTGRHNKCHRLRDLNSRHVFSHSYEGWKSTIRMPADLVPQGRLSSWPADSCLLTVSFQVWERVSKLSCASFYKDTNPIGGGPL